MRILFIVILLSSFAVFAQNYEFVQNEGKVQLIHHQGEQSIVGEVITTSSDHNSLTYNESSGYSYNVVKLNTLIQFEDINGQKAQIQLKDNTGFELTINQLTYVFQKEGKLISLYQSDEKVGFFSIVGSNYFFEGSTREMPLRIFTILLAYQLI